jgi:WD40 repeat protein
MVGESYSQNHGVYHIAFGQDGKKLLAVAQDGTLTSWDLETRQPVHRWNPLHVKDSNVLYGYHVSFSPDTRLASVNDGSVINVVDIQTGEQISQPLKGNVNNIGDMAFSPDGKMLASVGGKGVILWDLGNRNPLGLVLHKHGGSSLTISPDGKTLAADTFFDDGSWRGSIGLWDITTHNLIGQLDSADKPVTFSPNGKMLATGSSDGVILWDAATHKLIDQFQLGANTYISSLAFSPDGEMVAAGNGLVVTLWDLENHAFSGQPLKANTAIVESMAFSPDGKTLAVGDASNAIILWDIQTRHSIKWTASSDDVDSVAFSPDGETLASTSRDGKIMLWDVKSQKAIERPFIVPTSAIPTTLSFSPDGKMLASGNYDSTINLWNVATRQPIGQGLIGNEWPVGQVAFSPDGNTLATTSNKIILWDVNSQSWVEKICQRVGRNFTRSEWLQYFRDETYRATCPQWPLETESTPTPVVTP